MNRCYKTVWNQSKRCWVAVSELAKGHTKSSPSSPSKTKKSVLAIAVGSVLASQILVTPALADFIEEVAIVTTGEVVTSGGIQNIHSGGYVLDSKVNVGGIQNISNGGHTVNNIINGVQNVYSGGIASASSLVNSGEQHVFDGGITNDVIISGYYSSQHVSSGGIAKGSIVSSYNEQIVYEGGVAENTRTVVSARLRISGGVTSGTIINGGSEVIYSGGKAYGASILYSYSNYYGQFVNDGGEAHATTIGDGYQQVNSGGTAYNAQITHSRGEQVISAGGEAHGTVISAGEQIINGGYAKDTTLFGGYVNVFNGGIAEGTIASAGSIYVRSGGIARDTTISDEGVLYVYTSAILEGATLITGTGGIAHSGAVATINNGVLTFKQSEDQTLAVRVIGTGSLVKEGTNALTLTANNAYTGGTIINGGTLAGTVSLWGNIEVNTGGKFLIERDTDDVLAGVVTGVGDVEKAGTGILTVTSGGGFAGSFIVTEGAVKGSASNLGGNIVNNSKAIFDDALSGTYVGTMTGTGQLEKIGIGTSIVKGALNHTGGTTITEGMLQGSTSTLKGAFEIATGAKIVYDQTGLKNGSLDATFTGAGIFSTVGTGTLLINKDTTLTNAVEHNGGLLEIAAGKQLTISNPAGLLIGNGATLLINPHSITGLHATKVDFATGSSIDFSGALGGTESYTLITTDNGITGFNNITIPGATITLDVFQAASVSVTNGGKNLEAGFGLVWNNGATAHGTLNIAKDKEFTLSQSLADNTNTASHGFSWDGKTLTKTGAGKLLLTGTNSYTGDTVVSEGVLEGTTASIKGNLINAASVTFNQADNGTFSGVISGVGSLDKTGVGKLTLTGNNTYTGNVSIAEGSLEGSATSLKGNIDNKGSLIFNQAKEGTFAGIISGAGAIEKTGAGKLVLTGANTNTGAVAVKKGILAGSASSLTGDISVASGATVTFDQGTDATYGKQLSGKGSLSKEGVGNLAISNSFTIGALNVGAGRLSIAAGKTATVTGDISVANGANLGIDMSGTAAITAGSLEFLGSNAIYLSNWGGSVADEQTLITTTNGIKGNVIVYDAITGKAISDSITLADYMTATIAKSNADKDLVAKMGLVWNNNAVAHGTFNIAKTYTLSDSLSDNTTAITGLDGWDGKTLTKTGAGKLLLTGTNSYTGDTVVSEGVLEGTTASIKGNLINAASVTFNQADNGTFSGVISGVGSLDKTGVGKLTLTGNNTYTGNVSIAEGSLEGSATSLKGNIDNKGSLIFNQAKEGTFAGIISGAGAIEKTGAGKLVLTGANTNTGAVAVKKGILAGSASSLTGDISVASGAMVTFDQGTDATYGKQLSGKGSLSKEGVGNLTISNSFTIGALNVGAGRLSIAAGKTATVTGDISVANSAHLGIDMTSNPAIDANAINLAGDNRLYISSWGSAVAETQTLVATKAGITGNIDVYDAATGNLLADNVREDVFMVGNVLKANGDKDIIAKMSLVWNHNTTAHGTFTVAKGNSFTVAESLSNNSNSASHAFSWDGKTLTKKGAGTLFLTGINSYTGGTNVVEGILKGNTKSLQGNINTSATTAVEFDQEVNGTYAGVISGAGALTKSGKGVLTLTGMNAQSGGITVTAGTLKGGSSNLKGNIVNNSKVVLNDAVEADHTGIISGTGSLEKTGVGTLTLKGVNTYSGGTTVSEGTLSGDVTSLQGNIVNNSGVTFNQAVQGTYAGNVTGTGTVTKKGAGELLLTGNNAQTINMVVTEGTLKGDTTSLKGDITNDGTVVFNQSAEGTYSGLISGLGAVIKEGTSALTFGESQSVARLDVNAGALGISADKALTVAGALTMSKDTTLALDMTSATIISAGSLEFKGNNTLEIAHFGSNAPTTLITTANGITGDFGVTVGGAALSNVVDLDTYIVGTITKQNGNKDIVADLDLVWNQTEVGQSHGTFNISAGSDFAISNSLDDKSGAALGFGWDGTTLNKTGGGTLILEAENTYSGATYVNEGSLMVGSSENNYAASIVSDVYISGGVLSGHGQIKGVVTAENGSYVSPGSSIGTLTVGQMIFENGSTYLFEVNEQGADQLIVDSTIGSGDGSVRIDAGATLAVLASAGDWQPNQTYTILEADGGVDGVFTEVTKDTIFLNHEVLYNATNIQLHLERNNITFAQIGLSGNQMEIGQAIEMLGINHPIYQQVVGMNAKKAQDTYDNLSGEIHGSAQSAFLTNSRYVRSSIYDHLYGQSDVVGSSLEHGYNVWVNAWGYDGSLKSDNNAAKVNNSGYGFLVGADLLKRHNVTLGLAIGYENGDIKVKGSRKSKADLDAVHLMAYGQTYAGPVEINAGLGYSWLGVDAKRSVSVGNLTSENNANYDGHMIQLFAQGRYLMDINDHLAVAPYAGLSYQQVKMDSFKETGDFGSLHGKGKSNSVVSSTIGVSGEYHLDNKSKLFADIGWQHNFNDVAESKVGFAEHSSYNIRGAKINRDSAVVGFGASFDLGSPRSQLKVGYKGEMGNEGNNHSVKLRWEYSF